MLKKFVTKKIFFHDKKVILNKFNHKLNASNRFGFDSLKINKSLFDELSNVFILIVKMNCA